MKQSKNLFIFLLVLLSSSHLMAQVITRRVSNDFPVFLNLIADTATPYFNIKPLNLAEIQAEDIEEAKQALPPRFGRSVQVNIGIEAGLWRNTNVGKTWQLGIHSKGSKGFMIVFDKFILPEGAELYIYNSQKTMLMGPITHSHNNSLGRFSTDLIESDSIVLELLVAPRAFKNIELHMESILYAYKAPLILNTVDTPLSLASCQRDLRCPEGDSWSDQSDAVAMIIDPIKGRLCTGSLLNNACNNLRPIFYTAYHCADIDHNTVLADREKVNLTNFVFRFGYKSKSCDGEDNPVWQSISNCVLISESRHSDGLLLELKNRPDPKSGITYAGWTTNISNVTQTTSIHHAQGNPMKISIDFQNPVFGNIPLAPNWTLWNAIQSNWDIGITERGSSGGPLFDQNQRVVGQHTGGYKKHCLNRRNVGGTLAQAFNIASFRDGLTDDRSIVQTNLTKIPYLDLPDFICDIVPLALTNFPLHPNGWSFATRSFETPIQLQGVTLENWFTNVKPIPDFNGAGFIEFQLRPTKVICEEPLIIHKDFIVGKPLPIVSFSDDGNRCMGWLSVDNPLPSNTYSWRITQGNRTYYYNNRETVFLRNSSDDNLQVTYELTATNNCGATTIENSFNMVRCRGIYAKESLADVPRNIWKMQISPNPAVSELNIQLSGYDETLLSTLSDIQIINLAGQTVYKSKQLLDTTMHIDIGTLQNGFYILELKGEGFSSRQKFSVSNK